MPTTRSTARQISQCGTAPRPTCATWSVVSAPQHGIQFVAADTPEAAEVRAKIEAFLALGCDRPRPVPLPPLSHVVAVSHVQDRTAERSC